MQAGLGVSSVTILPRYWQCVLLQECSGLLQSLGTLKGRDGGKVWVSTDGVNFREVCIVLMQVLC